MSLFAEEDIVCKVLHDPCDDHQTPANDSTVILGYHDINDFRGNNGWRNEAAHDLV